MVLLAACSVGARVGPGIRDARAPDGWVEERPELDALFPESDLVSAAESWQRAGRSWKHCYAAEAASRDGERERFTREVERLGYRPGRTPMGDMPAFVEGDVSGVLMLPSEEGALDAVLREAGETIERTTTVQVCVTHPEERGAERAAAFVAGIAMVEPMRDLLDVRAASLRHARYSVAAGGGRSASLAYAYDGDPGDLGRALRAEGFTGDAPSWTLRGDGTSVGVTLGAGELTVDATR